MFVPPVCCNTPVTLEFSPTAVVRTAHRLGIASKLEPNASIALGTSEVTPLEMTAAFVPFSNGGYGVLPGSAGSLPASSSSRSK